MECDLAKHRKDLVSDLGKHAVNPPLMHWQSEHDGVYRCRYLEWKVGSLSISAWLASCSFFHVEMSIPEMEQAPKGLFLPTSGERRS